MKTGSQAVILKLKKELSSEDYKALYFNLRRQLWSGILMLPPDIDFLGVSDLDADVLIVKEENKPPEWCPLEEVNR